MMKGFKIWFCVLIAFLAAVTSRAAVLEWDAIDNVACLGYRVYWKESTNPAPYNVTNISGRLNTNVTLVTSPSVVYEAYVTGLSTNNNESDASGMVRFQNFYVSGIGKSTPLTLGDLGTTNFPGFVLKQQPTNGVITGTAPNVIFTPSQTFGSKDMFVYSSPATFQGYNITNYYGVIKTLTNKPPTLIIQ
jgi:hypothetical protein